MNFLDICCKPAVVVPALVFSPTMISFYVIIIITFSKKARNWKEQTNSTSFQSRREAPYEFNYLFIFFSPLELPIPLQPVTPVQSTSTSSHGHTPSHWEHVPEDLEFMRVPLTCKSDEFKLAESLFRQTMSENKASIISIERVQNPFLWKKYAEYVLNVWFRF